MAKEKTAEATAKEKADAMNALYSDGERPAGADANMQRDYDAAREEQEKRNAEAAEAAFEDAKTKPRVALGTAEAIALGVGNGDSPTEGDRPEGWETVAGDVRTTSALAGELAEVDAGAEEALRKAEAERAAKVAEAQAKVEEKAAEATA